MMEDLDKIKTTITLSLYTKNKLRELKGNMSYEDYINYLVRSKENKLPVNNNYIELQKIERKRATYSINEYKFVISYNRYNHSNNFQFDILIEYIIKRGKKISFKQFLNELSTNELYQKKEFKIYFILLEFVIQKEIESIFNHKGRFEDHYLWEIEFKNLNLPKTSFEEDVLVKLRNYEKGLHYDN